MARRIRKGLVRGAIVALFFWTPIASVNPASRLALVDSLLSAGTPATDESHFFNRTDMVRYGEHFYSDKPPLLALYSAAVVAPVHRLVGGFDGVGGKILYWWIVASSSGLALLVMALFIRALHERPGMRLPWGWVAAGALGATCILPFARTYNDHIVEAAVVLAVFSLLVRSARSPGWSGPALAGLLSGLLWWLHPLVGTVIGGATAAYWSLAPDRDDAAAPVGPRRAPGRLAAFAGFGLVAALTFGAGAAVHRGMYGRALPFYFAPETYLWADGPGGVESAWLDDPTVPGLSVDRIRARFDEIGLPADRLQGTLDRFDSYRRSVENPLSFAADRAFRYGQLTFTPLVLFCLALAVGGGLGKRRERRPETLWMLACVIGLVAASVALRAVPGGSFGDRHLLPVVPLIVSAGALALKTDREAFLFKALALLGMATMLPGAMAPWVTPGDVFLAVNLVFSGLALAGTVAVWRSKAGSPLARGWDRLQVSVGARQALLAVTVLAGLQVALYLATVPRG